MGSLHCVQSNNRVCAYLVLMIALEGLQSAPVWFAWFFDRRIEQNQLHTAFRRLPCASRQDCEDNGYHN
jgi:hypothetical protein